MTLLGSCNRDESRWGPTAADLDLGREGAGAHLAFGSGIHHCLGAALARLEGAEAVPALVRRFPAMELATDDPVVERPDRPPRPDLPPGHPGGLSRADLNGEAIGIGRSRGDRARWPAHRLANGGPTRIASGTAPCADSRAVLGVTAPGYPGDRRIRPRQLAGLYAHPRGPGGSMLTTTALDGEYTLADWEAMPDDGRRYELIGGTITVSPPPVPDHQIGLGQPRAAPPGRRAVRAT